MSHEVFDMIHGVGPTAPLADYLEARKDDEALWWRVSARHQEGLFDAALAEIDRLRLALHNIQTQADTFEDQACTLYGGDSPQRLWAWGLNTYIQEVTREREQS